VKHCNTIQWDHYFFMFSLSSHSSLFHTDTHYALPWRESNRRQRCTILGWSIATQYSEIITSSCFLYHLILLSFIQTLATLDLYDNQIGDEGAQYLDEALQHNTVRSSFLHVFSIVSFFFLSYRHSLHSTLIGIKSETKVHNIWVKHCNTIQWDHHFFIFSSSSHSSLFHTDTHYTQPVRQSNRLWRCETFEAPAQFK